MPARRVLYVLCLAGLVGSLVLLYGHANVETPAIPIGHAVQIATPLGLPPVPMPSSNPPTEETIALGRRLYYDTALSVDNSVSCATCHMPAMGFSDGKRVSNGVDGKAGLRNSPTVLNAAYLSLQFWDGRAPSLEKQSEGPVANPVEMAHSAVSGDSAFDRYYYGHDQAAMSPAQIRGFDVFRDPRKGIASRATPLARSTRYSPTTNSTISEWDLSAERPLTKGATSLPTIRAIRAPSAHLHCGTSS